jgi:hypothetical protein
MSCSSYDKLTWAASMLLAMSVAACGPDPCTQLYVDAEDRAVECGWEPSEDNVCPGGDGCLTCDSEHDARLARCQSECINAADCEAFLEAGAASQALGNCMEACFDKAKDQ